MVKDKESDSSSCGESFELGDEKTFEMCESQSMPQMPKQSYNT